MYMVKTLKKILLQNQGGFEAESWYKASGMQGLPTSNDDPRMTFDLSIGAPARI